MTTLTQKTEEKATEGQIRQITRVAQDAAEKAIKDFSLSKDGAQKVHANGDEVANAVNQAVTEVLKKLTYVETYESEEVQSNYGYLSGYKPLDIVPQTNRLRELFPGLGFANQELLGKIERGEVKLPTGAEGWFAIPNIWKKGGQPKIGVTYSACVQTVLDLVKKTRNGAFYNYREGSIDEKHIRQLAKTKEAMGAISEAQGNPGILLIAAQFGKRHAGRSVRRARVVMSETEFGLGAFAIGCMLLTHPKRLQDYNDLWIDCAGDEFGLDGAGDFSRSPYWCFDGGGVGFGACSVGRARGRCGTTSGFSPQS